MNTTAEQIKAAKSIQTLCDLLNSTKKEKVNRYLDDNDLPTFGGTDPAQTEYVFSWDATHVLVNNNKWELSKRCLCGEASFHCKSDCESIGGHIEVTLKKAIKQDTINLGTLKADLFNGFNPQAVKAYFRENVIFTDYADQMGVSDLDYYDTINDAVAAMILNDRFGNFDNYVTNKSDDGEFYIDIKNNAFNVRGDDSVGLITTFHCLFTAEDWFDEAVA